MLAVQLPAGIFPQPKVGPPPLPESHEENILFLLPREVWRISVKFLEAIFPGD